MFTIYELLLSPYDRARRLFSISLSRSTPFCHLPDQPGYIAVSLLSPFLHSSSSLGWGGAGEGEGEGGGRLEGPTSVAQESLPESLRRSPCCQTLANTSPHTPDRRTVYRHPFTPRSPAVLFLTLLENTTLSEWSIICLVRTVYFGGYGFQGAVTVPLAWEV